MEISKDKKDNKEKEEKMNIVDKARKFTMKKHEGQLDDSGEPYFCHPEQVASILCVVTNDDSIISAAYLHDTLEDTATTLQELKDAFGEEIANLVFEVTHEGKKDVIGYYFPRLKSRKAILIKLADRLSNLSRMETWDIKRQEQYLRKSKFWKSEGKEDEKKNRPLL